MWFPVAPATSVILEKLTKILELGKRFPCSFHSYHCKNFVEHSTPKIK